MIVLRQRLSRMSAELPTCLKCRWAFNVGNWEPSRDDWCLAIQSIQPDERSKVRTFRYQSDSKASLVGRLFMQKWALTFLNKQAVFSRSERGRPISPDLSWDLNVSHQGDFTVFAAEKAFCDQETIRVGVDVMKLSDARHETVEKRHEFFRLMRRQFTDNEWRQIDNPVVDKSIKTDPQLALFFRHWTLKESFVKAVGLGLTINLQRLNFQIISPLRNGIVTVDTRIEVDGQADSSWMFEESLLDDDHCVAVAVSRPNYRSVDEPLKFHTFSNIEDILNGLHPFSYESNDVEWADFLAKHPAKPF